MSSSKAGVFFEKVQKQGGPRKTQKKRGVLSFISRIVTTSYPFFRGPFRPPFITIGQWPSCQRRFKAFGASLQAYNQWWRLTQEVVGKDVREFPGFWGCFWGSFCEKNMFWG